MRRRSITPLFAAALVAISAHAAAHVQRSERTLDYTYSFGGREVGTGKGIVKPDGTISYRGSMTLGAKIEFAIDGHRASDLHDRLTVRLTSAGKTNTIEWKLDGFEFLTPTDQKLKVALPKPIVEGSYFPFVNWKLDEQVNAVESAGGKSIELFVFDNATKAKIEIAGKRVLSSPEGPIVVRTLRFGTLAVELAFDSSHECVGLNVPAQGFRVVAKGFETAFRDPFSAYPELSPADFKTSEESTWATMRDGVKLRTDVVRPIGLEKAPAILIRTPYGRAAQTLVNSWFAARGYVVVTQDVRGRGESEGEWDPFVNERKDGEDAIDWISKQSWSDGKVGMIGGSYLGFVQWAAAVSNHPALKCIIPQVSPPMSAMRNIPYLYGVPMLLPDLWWLRIVEGRNADMTQATAGLKNADALLNLPLSKVDDGLLGRNLPMWDTWVQRDRASAWNGFNFQSELAKVKIPSLSVSGYFDGDEIGTMLNWETRAKAGCKDQWLIYGPWPHGFNASTHFGGVDFGEGSVLELDPVYLRFFDTYLKGKSVKWDATPKVKAFRTGANRWMEGADWPLPQSKPTTLALLAGGKLASSGAAGKMQIVFDPKGVTVSEKLKGEKLDLDGSLDVDLKEFKGATLFKTEAMKSSHTVTGPIELDLAFATSSKSTDFIAMPVDISPDGKLRMIGLPGAVRASYRDGDTPTDLVPGKRYRSTVRLWDFNHEFAPGHRFGILLSCEAFPSYARNLGTNEPLATATKMMIQKNTIFLGGKDGSVLRLRVLP